MFYVLLIALAALAVFSRPLAIRFLPDDIAGPDGWYFDTECNEGILDFGPSTRVE